MSNDLITNENEIEKIISYVFACMNGVPHKGASEFTKNYIRSCIRDKVDMNIGEKVIERMLG